MNNKSKSIVVRVMDKSDLSNGFLETLKNSNPLNISHDEGIRYLEEITKKNPSLKIYVAEKREFGIVSLASLNLTYRFGGIIASIEDVVTRKGFEGQGLASLLIEALVSEAESLGVYKIILSTHKKNEKFYQKFGFITDQLSMKRLGGT